MQKFILFLIVGILSCYGTNATVIYRYQVSSKNCKILLSGFPAEVYSGWSGAPLLNKNSKISFLPCEYLWDELKITLQSKDTGEIVEFSPIKVWFRKAISGYLEKINSNLGLGTSSFP